MPKKKPFVVNSWPTNKEKPAIWNDDYRHLSNGTLVAYKKPKMHPWRIYYPYVDQYMRLKWSSQSYRTFNQAVLELNYRCKLAVLKMKEQENATG